MSKSFRTSIIVFLVIFLLTQDYLIMAKWPDSLWAGLPSWLFYFAGIHILFILAIYRLAETKSPEQ